MIDSNLPTVTAPQGRGLAYSDKVREAIIRNLKIGCTRAAAYGAAGVSEKTFYRWMTDDDRFAASVVEAEGYAERVYTGRLARAAAAGDTTATKFWLERRRPAGWREKMSIDAHPSTEDELSEDMTEGAIEARLSSLARLALERGASGADRDTPVGSEQEAGAGETS